MTRAAARQTCRVVSFITILVMVLLAGAYRILSAAAPVDCSNLPETTKAYIAGFIDGEGWIGIQCARNTRSSRRGRKFSGVITIVNTNLEALEQLRAEVGMGHFVEMPRLSERHKQLWHLTFSTRQAARLLEAVSPYLRIKRRQAEVYLEFMGTADAPRRQRGKPLSDEDFAFQASQYEEMRRLNKRGVEAA